MGHEIRTPLNAILGFTEILRRRAGRPEQLECSPYEIISEVLSITRVRAREKGIALECQWVGGAGIHSHRPGSLAAVVNEPGRQRHQVHRCRST